VVPASDQEIGSIGILSGDGSMAVGVAESTIPDPVRIDHRINDWFVSLEGSPTIRLRDHLPSLGVDLDPPTPSLSVSGYQVAISGSGQTLAVQWSEGYTTRACAVRMDANVAVTDATTADLRNFEVR
jgi:hypothetical protein